VTGKWKALHYVIRRVYSPVMLSAVLNEKKKEVEIHLTSEVFHQEKLKGAITVELLSYKDSANPLKTRSLEVEIAATTSEKVIVSPLTDILEDTIVSNDVFLHVEFTDVSGKYYTYTDLFLTQLKHVHLPKAEVSITSVQEGAKGDLVVTLQASATAVFVVIEAKGILGYFSDNAFTMLAGRTYVLSFVPSKDVAKAVTAESLKESLQVRSLVDTY